MSGTIWQPLNYQNEMAVNTFGKGVNTFLTPFEIQDGELTDDVNMCSDKFPALTVRNDRIPLSSGITTTHNGLGRRGTSDMFVVDGINWKRWDFASSSYVMISTSLSSTEAAFDEFASGTFRYSIMMNSTQKLYWDGGVATTALAISDTNLPFTKLFSVHKGRVYALAANDISFCALNLITDWTTVNDAGSIDVTRSVGNGTAIHTFNDHVIVWSENSMHELFGTGPLNYELKDITNDIGCVDNKTVVEVTGRLFWLDYTGVYIYTGGQPLKISDPVDKWIKGINWSYKNLCCAGNKGDKMYLSVPYNSTQLNTILTYDTYKETWNVQSGNFKYYTNVGNTLYGAQSTTLNIWNMESTSQTGNDNSTAIPWSFETKAYNGNIGHKKTISKMYVVHEGSSAGTMNISYTSNAMSTTYSSLVASSDMTIDSEAEIHKVNVPTSDLDNVDWFKLKFAGTGKVTVHSLNQTIRVRK